MSSCSRCDTLSRWLADERKDHESTKAKSRGQQGSLSNLRLRVKELETILADALAKKSLKKAHERDTAPSRGEDARSTDKTRWAEAGSPKDEITIRV